MIIAHWLAAALVVGGTTASAEPNRLEVEVTPSEPIDRTRLDSSTFRVLNPSFVPIAGTIAVAADALSATFTPSAPLAGNSLHRVQVFSVPDLAGNVVQSFSSTFTTGPP